MLIRIIHYHLSYYYLKLYNNKKISKCVGAASNESVALYYALCNNELSVMVLLWYGNSSASLEGRH